MVGRNYLTEPVLSEMRHKYVECKQQLHHYKQLYFVQKKKSDILRKDLVKINKKLFETEEDFENVQNRIAHTVEKEPLKRTRKRKQWDKIKCEKTK